MFSFHLYQFCSFVSVFTRVSLWCLDPLSFCPSCSAGSRYGCSSLRWSGGGLAAVCDTGAMCGCARISPQMPPSPRRHHRFFVCSYRRLSPWQLQAPQTGWVHTHTVAHHSTCSHKIPLFIVLCLFSQLFLFLLILIKACLHNLCHYHTAIYIIP